METLMDGLGTLIIPHSKMQHRYINSIVTCTVFLKNLDSGFNFIKVFKHKTFLQNINTVNKRSYNELCIDDYLQSVQNT